MYKRTEPQSMQEFESEGMVDSCSIVITTYNSAEYVVKALDSVVNAFKCLKHEVIVVDDCSSDIEELERVVEEYESAKLLKKKTKTNAADSRNIGIKKSAYDYVFLLDSDDEFLYGAPERRLCLHKKNKVGVLFGAFRLVSRNGSELKGGNGWDGADIRRYLFVKNGDFRTSTISIFKPYYKGTLFDEASFKHQDWIFGIRCYDNSESIGHDEIPATKINIDNKHRMSSSINISASMYFCNKYLPDENYKNLFFKQNAFASLRLGDYKGLLYFSDRLVGHILSFQERAILRIAGVSHKSFKFVRWIVLAIYAARKVCMRHFSARNL